VATLPYGGRLELDEGRQRLYVYQPFPSQDEEPVIHVLDTGALNEIGTLPGAPSPSTTRATGCS